ncbi:glutaredoxin family protein [Bacillus sp. P14.5]|uniref:glutaredoxin family protein n=1 Tax=Bacillus sp. P14.5 TaxID=1983400 RepID=UPI000DEA7C6E|nr:glutaredoxin family protein [Bacillus sp. P14.5]
MLLLYTIEGCSQCHKVRGRLNSLSLPFIERNILKHKSLAAELQAINGEVVIPALRADNKIFTGCQLNKILKDENVHELHLYVDGC